jgi:hypothetical protein
MTAIPPLVTISSGLAEVCIAVNRDGQEDRDPETGRVVLPEGRLGIFEPPFHVMKMIVGQLHMWRLTNQSSKWKCSTSSAGRCPDCSPPVIAWVQ